MKVFFKTKNSDGMTKRWNMSIEDILQDWYGNDAEHLPDGDDPVIKCSIGEKDIPVNTVDELISELNILYWKQRQKRRFDLNKLFELFPETSEDTQKGYWVNADLELMCETKEKANAVEDFLETALQDTLHTCCYDDELGVEPGDPYYGWWAVYAD